MKFLTFLFFFSFNLFACPNLTGTYSHCRNIVDAEVELEFTLSQETKDGVTTYRFSDSKSLGLPPKIFKADDQMYTVSDNALVTRSLAICVGNRLRAIEQIADAKNPMEPHTQTQYSFVKNGNAVTFQEKIITLENDSRLRVNCLKQIP